MMQTRRHSIIEAVLNVFSGMVIAFLISMLATHFELEIQKYIWKGFEWKISIGGNIVITVVLTIVSIIRSYAWRRHFNKKLMRSYYEATKK